MLIPFIIMLREGIEAALIVGIIASYLSQTGRQSLIPAVIVGVLLAVATSLFAGALLQLMSAEFPQKQQEFFEGVVGLIAVGVLSAMVFWMKKTARSISGELRASVDRALHGKLGSWALVGMVFLAVAREGLESVFFLQVIFQQSQDWQAPVGALLGILVAVVLGYAIYHGGLHINLRRFFTYTGLFILFVSAGLFANVLRKFHEAGIWNHGQQVVLDLSHVLPADSITGSVLSGLLGYLDTPVLSEVIAYIAFLTIALVLFFRPAKP